MYLSSIPSLFLLNTEGSLLFLSVSGSCREKGSFSPWFCLWLKYIFIPSGHSEPDRGGTAAGPDQLLPQLHGAHQAAKEKVKLTQQFGNWLLKPPGDTHTLDLVCRNANSPYSGKLVKHEAGKTVTCRNKTKMRVLLSSSSCQSGTVCMFVDLLLCQRESRFLLQLSLFNNQHFL